MRVAPRASADNSAVTRPSSPRKALVLAVVLVAVGSLTPWIDTAFGDTNGIDGAGLWTLYAAAIGLAGAALKRPRIAAGHAAVLAAAALALPAWQLGRLLPLGGFGSGWTPGFGMIAVFGGGIIAMRAALRLARAHRG